MVGATNGFMPLVSPMRHPGVEPLSYEGETNIPLTMRAWLFGTAIPQSRLRVLCVAQRSHSESPRAPYTPASAFWMNSGGMSGPQM